MQAHATMSLSSLNSNKPVEITTSKLELAHNDDTDGSAILITGVEKRFNQQIKILLTPEFHLNMIEFDREKIFPELHLNSSKISSSNDRYKLVKILLYQKIIIAHEHALYSGGRPLLEFSPQLFLEFDINSTSSNKNDNALIRSMIQKGFRTITAMLFESFDGDGQTLQQYVLLNTEHDGLNNLNVEIIKVLFNCEANVHLIDQHGRSLIHVALRERNLFNMHLKVRVPNVIETLKDINCKFFHSTVKCIEALIESKIDINAINQFGLTPLNDAVCYGDIEAVKTILKKNPDVNIQCSDGRTVLHRAVMKRNLELFEMLLENNANIHIRDNDGQTPLYFTLNRLVIFDDYDTNKIREKMIITLLDRGSNPNIEGQYSRVFLSWACRSGDLFTVKTVLKYNVDVNFKNSEGRSPLHDVVYLEEFGRDYNLELRIQYVKILLENGADVNSVDNNGETALHSAAQVYEAFPIVKILLENKADVNLKSKLGRTPLHYACRTKNLEMIKSILDNGVNINIRDNEGRNPLHYAAWCEYWSGIDDREIELKSIIDLLKTQINIDDIDIKGRTPLHMAFEHAESRIEMEYVSEFLDNHDLIASTLIKAGASVNAVDKHGQTPLHHAIANDFFGPIEVLINGGADINILDGSNESPLKIYYDDMNRSNDETSFPDGLIHAFLEHIVKLHYVKIYVCKQNLDMVFKNYDDLSVKWIEEYQNICAEELDRMKLEIVPHNKISYYDVLMKSVHDLVHLVGNNELMQSLLSDKFIEKYPIYCYVLQHRFIEGQKRGLLVQKTHAYTKANIFAELPDPCIHEILRYLTADELIKLSNITKYAVFNDQE